MGPSMRSLSLPFFLSCFSCSILRLEHDSEEADFGSGTCLFLCGVPRNEILADSRAKHSCPCLCLLISISHEPTSET